mmetsp:Transcript_31447/g.58245  ORF Transcript_31447/g.58245 Transcript_31447/m.58245 type:complete len:83 (-) Transcript_31447:933-1181(-)
MKEKDNSCLPVPKKKFSPTAINNYMALLTRYRALTLVDNSIGKTNNQWTAGHSLIALVSLVVVVMCSHFYIMTNNISNWIDS